MALPDYSSASTASFGGGAVTRNQRQRQRRRARRQNRRQNARTRRITNSWQSDDPGTPYDYNYDEQPVAGEGYEYDYDDSQYPGFQGDYVAPDNSYEHPFYTPSATYARPGENYHQWEPGSKLQQDYIERNPAAGYYGIVSQLGYGGLDAKSQTVQGMYQDFVTGYEAAKAFNNFEGNFQSFMGQQNIPNLLEQMTSRQLGIDRSAFDGRDRWQFRG